jgi:hypothetical protein
MPVPVGRSQRLALSASLMAWAALAIAPAGAQTRWAKDPAVRFQTNDSWDPGFWAKGGSRLVCDLDSNLYLNLDDSLLVFAGRSGSWRTVLREPKNRLLRTPPLTVGKDGILLWDAGISRDQGRTWNQVHFGKTFGNISAIAPGDRSWIFAAPGYDDLLASRDGGKTWANAVRLAQGKAPERIVAKYLAAIPDSHILFALTDPATSDPTLEEIRWLDDSLLITTHQATRTFPDSQVSAFATPHAILAGPMLWVGTWGQGVWASSDWGKSWSPRNEGLIDLHVEALVIDADGMAHALTLDGLYSLSPTSALAFSPQRHQPAVRARLAGPGILFGYGSEVPDPYETLFRADGRSAPPGRRSPR